MKEKKKLEEKEMRQKLIDAGLLDPNAPLPSDSDPSITTHEEDMTENDEDNLEEDEEDVEVDVVSDPFHLDNNNVEIVDDLRKELIVAQQN